MKLVFVFLTLLPFSHAFADEVLMQEGRYATGARYCGFNLMYDPSNSGIIIVYTDNAYNGVWCNRPGLTQQFGYVGAQNLFRRDVPDSSSEDDMNDSYYCIIKPVSRTRITMACYWSENNSVITAHQYFIY